MAYVPTLLVVWWWSFVPSSNPVSRLTGHVQPVNDIQFSPDGRYFASASFDKKVGPLNTGPLVLSVLSAAFCVFAAACLLLLACCLLLFSTALRQTLVLSGEDMGWSERNILAHPDWAPGCGVQGDID
jgi:hypothetical protein